MPFFVEVGVCDFDTCEQLILNGWSGLMVEPVKYYFDKLKKYENIKYENVAISDTIGETEIHFINPQMINENSENEWLKGISSLNGGGCFAIEINKKVNFLNKTLKEKVKLFTLDYMCKKYNIKSIDFLKIDTEGHDFKVLKSINLDKIYVKMIKIEHKHLSHIKIVDYLKERNYIVWVETDDIYAIK